MRNFSDALNKYSNLNLKLRLFTVITTWKLQMDKLLQINYALLMYIILIYLYTQFI